MRPRPRTRPRAPRISTVCRRCTPTSATRRRACSARCEYASRVKPFAPLVLLLVASAAAAAEPLSYDTLVWRPIGPYRGGRTKAAAGVPSRPGTFYIGVCNGGVWETARYGRTWQPIFDDQPTRPLGAPPLPAPQPRPNFLGHRAGAREPHPVTRG